ncbi:hypothetical protein ACPEIC_30630 [Stenotrophomonas sp. NPDC087984]
MNIGKAAVLVTAAAGAVVFGGAGAGAHGQDNAVKQLNNCDSKDAVSFGGPPSKPDCVNFADVFGDLTQLNDCESASGPTASSGNLLFSSTIVEGSQCANLAVSEKSNAKVDHRGGYGAGHR